ncbi:MAG: hypothetical protein AAGD00_06405 [Planctomycetota bacterium]
MSSHTKCPTLQSYRLIVYRRALHPELFKVKGRRSVIEPGFEFESWIMPGSHLLRFQIGDLCATELITDQDEGIPDRGMLAAIPCAGERDHEHEFAENLNYACALQTEQLPLNLYQATYEELIEFGGENDALIHQWTDDDGGKCASILDIQRYRGAIYAQGYHMIATGGLVLRTQSMFAMKNA